MRLTAVAGKAELCWMTVIGIFPAALRALDVIEALLKQELQTRVIGGESPADILDTDEHWSGILGSSWITVKSLLPQTA